MFPKMHDIMNIKKVNSIYFRKTSYDDYRDESINMHCIVLGKMLIKIYYYKTFSRCSIMIYYNYQTNYVCTFEYILDTKLFEERYCSNYGLKYRYATLKILKRLKYYNLNNIYKNKMYRTCIEYDYLILFLLNKY